MSKHSRMSAPSRLWMTAFAALALGVATPAVAHAQDKDCPPGSWFCGETQAPPTGENKDLQPLPEAKPAPAPTQPPPVVVYQPPAQAVVVQPREAPPPYVYVPRTPPKKTEWGINLHLGGAMIGTGRTGDASMGVVGIGLRVRPIPQLALEGDIDVAGGTDYNGLDRSEVAYTLNGLLFVNPKDKVQVYFLGGLGFASAKASAPRFDYGTSFDPPSYRYGYFGVQGGLGLEFRLSKVVALNTDLRGIYRGRIDSHRDEYPEFVSSDGRTTNKSGAGLFQVGITFYW